jgi:hypothetical protein
MRDALDDLYAKAMRDMHRQHAIAMVRQNQLIEDLVASAAIQIQDPPKKRGRGRPRSLSTQDKADMVWHFNLGVSKAELAEKYEVSVSTVWRNICLYR